MAGVLYELYKLSTLQTQIRCGQLVREAPFFVLFFLFLWYTMSI